MSRSRKHYPCHTNIGCKSQKKGKQKSNKRFRRCVHQLIGQGDYEHLPVNQRELTSPWDLGGDGKSKWFLSLDEMGLFGEKYLKFMRK